MRQPVVASTLDGVVFGEANPEQQVRCYQLAAMAFGPPLSEADYVEREEYLGQRPLARNKGWRIWCLSLAEDPSEVLATCKTIRKDLVVRDSDGSREEQAYCIASVFTNPRYRGHGFASLLMKHVAEWMDGPGSAAASMLYTIVGDFYVSKGWKKFPPNQATLSWLPTQLPSRGSVASPKTRLLGSEDISELCERDVSSIKASFGGRTVADGERHVAVLPTANVVEWLHDRARFISLKVHGKAPQHQGAICNAAGTWVYWYHDFKGRQLKIQRVRLPTTQTHEHEEALVGLLLDAIQEAREWDLSKVVIWDPSPCLLGATNHLADRFGISVETGILGQDIPSVRWKGSDETKGITVHMNEFYAWN